MEALGKVERRRREKDRVRFNVKYDPRLPKFSETLRSCRKILTDDFVNEEYLPFSIHGMVSESFEILKDLLVNSRLPNRRRVRGGRRENWQGL